MGVDFGFELHKSLLINELDEFIRQLQLEAKEFNQSSEAYDQIEIITEREDYGYIVWINYIPLAFFYGRWKNEQGTINKRAVFPIEEVGMIERPTFTNFLYSVFAKYLGLNDRNWIDIFDEGSSFITIRLPNEVLNRKDAIDLCLDYSWRTKEKARKKNNVHQTY